jgi:hypothetical protein
LFVITVTNHQEIKNLSKPGDINAQNSFMFAWLEIKKFENHWVRKFLQLTKKVLYALLSKRSKIVDGKYSKLLVSF